MTELSVLCRVQEKSNCTLFIKKYLSLFPHVELLDEVVLLRESAISFFTVDRRSVDMLFLTHRNKSLRKTMTEAQCGGQVRKTSKKQEDKTGLGLG